MPRAKALAVDASNGGKEAIETGLPYIAQVEVTGVTDLLFHGWNVEAIAEKAAARKGSEAKKTDNLESYVYRTDTGELAIPGTYLKGSIVNAAKFKQDPRSPRKSAMDLVKAAVIPMTALASLGIKDWEYDHAARVQVQRQGVTRVRPAIRAGWKATFDLMVTLPEYINSAMLHDMIVSAGKLIGLGDYRPTYGRYSVTRFAVLQDDEP